MLSDSQQNNVFFQGVCPDKKCRSVLYFSSHQTHVDCFRCGQKHNKNHVQDVQTPVEVETAASLWLREILLVDRLPKRGPEMVKVLGLSNYYCKLLSPLLTKYGMDKVTGRAKLLSDMNKGEMFDCSTFGDRAFLIEQEHISIPGYGRDNTGSMSYLSETLEKINSFNDGEERLIPIHADGDGHCLVHAVSRALVGRELFWHPLRSCLKKHFIENINCYKELFKDFVDEREWDSIVEECDPDFIPPDGELHGLRTIHIFGLANVLKRPIILLDTLECMKKLGDYAALFLPGLVKPNDCKEKDNTLNKPLCIAWSNYSHTHYIPLVGVQKRPLPVLPRELIPKVWGMDQSQIYLYIEFDENGNCTIGGNRMLSDAYILRLVSAMETLYFDLTNIHPSIVADAQLYLYPSNEIPGRNKVTTVVTKVKQAVYESRLYRCFSCNALCELRMESSWLKAGGVLYNNLANCQELVHNSMYSFPLHGIHCRYDSIRDELIPNLEMTKLKACTWCEEQKLHRVKSDGSAMNKHETKFNIQNIEFAPDDFSTPKSAELCDTLNECSAEQVCVDLVWNNKSVNEVVQLNYGKILTSADVVFRTTSEFIQKHFPEDVNNRKLYSMVSEQISKQVANACAAQNTSSLKNNRIISEQKNSSDNKKGISSFTTEASCNKLNAAPTLEFVKVVTSDGRQANLTLTSNRVSYSSLQSWIEGEFQVPIVNQKIKYGFPPKEFLPDSSDDRQSLLVKHGDRIMVEICDISEGSSELAIKSEKQEDIISESVPTIPAQRSTKFIFNAELQWSLAKMSPSLFKKHGTIYSQIIEKHGKNEKKHIYLESYPKKVFCYNSEEDSIELCVKPYGHFPIVFDIECLIEETKKGNKVDGVSSCSLLNSNPTNSEPANQMQSITSRPSVFHSDRNVQKKPPMSQTTRKGPGFSILTSPKYPEPDH